MYRALDKTTVCKASGTFGDWTNMDNVHSAVSLVFHGYLYINEVLINMWVLLEVLKAGDTSKFFIVHGTVLLFDPNITYIPSEKLQGE